MFCEMTPPIETSVRPLNQDSWILGSRMICERDNGVTSGCIVSWIDSSGSTFRLREITKGEVSLDSVDAAHSEQDRVHSAGTSTVVWKIGDVYCKVKSYVPGMPLEAETIRFVQLKDHDSTIPLPEVIHTWVDEALCRTFLLLRQIRGTTLAQYRSSLNLDQRLNIAATIAKFCKRLAWNSAHSTQSSSGGGTVEPFLNREPPDSRPSWKPYLLGPSLTNLFKSQPSAQDPPETFRFYHADLGPTNIIISEDGDAVTGVLDWESAGYYPEFWIATKPLVSAGFYLPPGLEKNRSAWAEHLAGALEAEGFRRAVDQYKAWRDAVCSLT